MPTTTSVEFFYDCSSPWTYFAFARIVPLMERLDLPLVWRPILVGGVFNAVNQQIYAARESMFGDKTRLAHYFKDMQDWADFIGIEVSQPDVFPVNSVKAMRGALFAAERDLAVPYSRAVFAAYWGDNRDISETGTLLDICRDVGLDPSGYQAAIGDQRYKDQLRENTDELIARGGYGSPTVFINGGDMYFGNDRLPLVEHRLRQLLARAGTDASVD
jgi:2-hydroxychromene-2-carboxylate isomerase